nr:organic cation transporter protein-like [Leptinotarsa decemlineata]
MEEILNVDSMLSHVGDFGRAQVMLLILFSFINFLSAFHYFGQTFISVIPEFKCDFDTERENVTVGKCDVSETHSNGSLDSFSCPNGWSFCKDNTYGYVGIIEELGWICSEDWKPALGQSIFFIGSVIGSLVLGILADVIGRLHVLIFANMLAFFGNIATILSKDVTIFALSRFVAGLATDSNFFMMYIIVMEYIRPSMRTVGLNISIGVFYCISCMIVPWVAVLMGNWKKFLLFVSVPHLLVLFFYFLVPESAQWLISKGRTDDAIQCFRKVAKINKKSIDEENILGLRSYCEKHVSVEKHHESFLDLLKTPKLRKKTLILIFKSMVMTLCYDAISRDVNGLAYSPFVVFSATSSTILPACLFISALQDKVGRKTLASGALLLSGIFTSCSGTILALITTPDPILIILLAIISRLCINVAYNSGAQYAVELIPTVVRGQGVSVIHVTGYAASFFSPQILYLSNTWEPAPKVILGVLLILGAIACLFLPETLNKTLPVTLKDGEQFGEDEGIFEFSCFKTPSESTMTLHRDVGGSNS